MQIQLSNKMDQEAEQRAVKPVVSLSQKKKRPRIYISKKANEKRTEK